MATNNRKNPPKISIQVIRGFTYGVFLAVFIVGLISIVNSVNSVRATYELTSVALSVTDTPSPTPTLRPTPFPQNYYVLLDELEKNTQYAPEKVIILVENAMEDVSHPIDLAYGHLILAESQMHLYNHDVSELHYEQSIELLLPLRQEYSTISDISRVYSLLIQALLEKGDYDSAENYYREMEEILEPLLDESTEAMEIAEGYSNLVKSANMIVGDKYLESFFEKMRIKLDPMLGDLVTIEEIGEVHVYLSETASVFYNTRLINFYNQAMVDRLKPLRNDLTTTKDIVLVNEYLGDAEVALGRYKFAAVYYLELVKYELTPRNVYRLANAYDVGGNLPCAYHWYQEMLSFNESDMVYKKEDISNVIGLIEEYYQEEEVPACP